MAYGDIVTGSVTAKEYYEIWAFDGQQGDQVAILMEGDGNLDAYLGLIDFATEEVVIEDDDSAGNSNALIEITLPATSTYLIIATRYNFDIGTSTGQYTLALSGGNGPTPISAPTAEEPDTAFEPVEVEVGIWYMGDLAVDTPVLGAIANDAYAQLYSVELEAGDEFVAVMMVDNGNLDSYLFFADEEFNMLAEDDNSGVDIGIGALDAVLNLTVADAGVYYVIATRANVDMGTTTGNYVLVTGAPEAGPEPQEEVVDDGLPPGVDFIAEVGIDQAAEASITDDSFMHLYAFEGYAGDEVTIIMSSTDDLDCYIGLLDPAGDVLAEDDDSGGDFNALITYTLPESGTYLIAATRAGIADGSTTGLYSLVVSSGPPEVVDEGAGLSGFGGLPGRVIEAEGGTFYLRGNGASGDPAKSPPVEAFMGLDTMLPGARNPFNPVGM
ncbi:MAG: PPC domain-containing protein, partial [Anaerolineae bacterium]|nr:PPC domain-containing protein [Anaerolineae bacterium]